MYFTNAHVISVCVIQWGTSMCLAGPSSSEKNEQDKPQTKPQNLADQGEKSKTTRENTRALQKP